MIKEYYEAEIEPQQKELHLMLTAKFKNPISTSSFA